ncbi:unnamed protein product [Adineta steineri]|uniref:Cullin-4 n=1 Tax=Adineta steineri TaxID=433720 RepID=A0A816D043_9BILA|nr:unnamed protein product [Adineta steineri]CAF1630584.1 unnamed protein product [Adineta steineri]
MSQTSDKNSSIRLKRDHQSSSLIENPLHNNSSSSSSSIKKIKQQHNNNSMDKDARNRYPSSSSSTYISSQNSSTTTKKLIIKNLKTTSLTPSPDYFDKIWPLLKQALQAILTGTNSPTNEEQLYRHIDHLCTISTNETNISLPSLLYDNLKKVLDEHMQALLPSLLSETNDSNDYLRLLNSIWNDHIVRSILIRQLFIVLDRTYVLHAAVPSIWELNQDLFRRYIMQNSIISNRCVTGLLKLIEQERRGETIDRSLMKNLIRMLIDLHLYKKDFEPSFLQSTEELYRNEGRQLIQTLELSQYLSHIERRLQEEQARITNYIDQSTKLQLIHLVENNLITNHIKQMLSKNFDKLINENRFISVALLYDLFFRIGISVINDLREAFGNYIKTHGRALVVDADKDDKMVDELLDFKEKLDHFLRECFHNNEKFSNTLKDSFENFMNQRANKPAELIAKAVDARLRSGNKEASEEELEKILDKLLILFRFIHGKDVFEAFYKKDLAKRLLVGKSASVDAEKSMLLKLKQECGNIFTSKLEGMFKDMELSKDIMTAFEQHMHNRKTPGTVGMYVYVLTMGFWPTYPTVSAILPAELCRLQEIFTSFYLSKHTGRKLQWQYTLDHCLLKGWLKEKAVKEFHVSLYQALVLLLFNQHTDLNYKDIQEQTKIQEAELQRTLQSLACGKIRLLNKKPISKDINIDDRFTLNTSFDHKLIRIKINQVQLKETPEENSSTTQRVVQDRQYQIDAAIVRIMKIRKTLSHAQLIAEVFSQLKFPISTSSVKTRIESLIEREYMKRSTDNANVYEYVA